MAESTDKHAADSKGMTLIFLENNMQRGREIAADEDSAVRSSEERQLGRMTSG